MRHEAVFSAEYDSPERAGRVERAIAPEVTDLEDDRSRAFLSRDGQTLQVTVEARDLVALRAALNTWLSLVSVAETAGDAC